MLLRLHAVTDVTHGFKVMPFQAWPTAAKGNLVVHQGDRFSVSLDEAGLAVGVTLAIGNAEACPPAIVAAISGRAALGSVLRPELASMCCTIAFTTTDEHGTGRDYTRTPHGVSVSL